MENLLVALDITNDARKRALLLHYIGENTLNIFEPLADTGGAQDYKKAIDALKQHFTPPKNTSFEIYKFRSANRILMTHWINFMFGWCTLPDITILQIVPKK